MDTRRKISRLADILERYSDRNLAVARGRYDVLTAGRVRAVAAARAQADALVAFVATDDPAAPCLLDQSARAQLAASLGAVDAVLLCDQTEAELALERLRPSHVVDIEADADRDIREEVLRRHADASS